MAGRKYLPLNNRKFHSQRTKNLHTILEKHMAGTNNVFGTECFYAAE